MRLSQIKTSAAPMTRRFEFPPEAPAKDQFVVALQYTSPKAIAECVDELSAGRKSEPTNDQRQKAIVSYLCGKVTALEGCTVGKLSSYVTMSPESVVELGGLEAEVDYSVENVQWLLTNVPQFANLCLDRATNLENFQDKEWAAQIANLKRGQVTSGAPQ